MPMTPPILRMKNESLHWNVEREKYKPNHGNMSVLHCTMKRGITVSLSIGSFSIDDECVDTIVALLVVAELVLFRTGFAVRVR